jgi:hypothetical protein
MNLGRIDYKIADLTRNLPDMMRVRQKFDSGRIEDVHRKTRLAFESACPLDMTGRRVAVTAGSRGIANILPITRCVVDVLISRGAKPFIVPAMGSHGGGSAEGQRNVLEHYGITEARVGAPIISSMETLKIGETPSGVAVYADKEAMAADHIVVVNRVKAHSDFKAEYESGICKMMMVGLGKHQGADAVHRAGSFTFGKLLPEAARVFIDTGKILCAVALVENANDETAAVEVLAPDEIIQREKELLVIAKKLQGRLMLDEIDILIVDEIGKDISGAGMDPNVTGRPPTGAPGFDGAPPIGKIIARSLTKNSGGNAIGMGMADIVTLNLAGDIDLAPTYLNALTAGVTSAGRLPMVANNDRDALTFAVMCLGGKTAESLKIVHIKNTLRLETIEVSANYAGQIRDKKELFESSFETKPILFDETGSMAGI